MKVICYSIESYDQPYLSNYLESHEVNFTDKVLSLETVDLAQGYDAVSVFSGDVVDVDIARRLYDNGVKYVTTRSVGYDHIDLESTRSIGIKVANVPAYSPYSVSEFAITLLLSLVRHTKKVNQRFDINDFRLDGLVGFDLYGKTVGVIGCGRIGSNIAKIMNAFGCRVLVADPAMKLGSYDEYTVVSLAKLLSVSDIVFLSCPLSEHTYHLIAAEELGQMKAGAILINTARGAVVDTVSLIDSLATGHLGGVAMDVYEYEKGLYFSDYSEREIDDPLLAKLRSFPNVLMTPHMGFLTEEALVGRAETTRDNLDQWEAKGYSDNDL